MSFIARWLGFGRRPPRIGLRPHADVELPLRYDDAFARVLAAIERALGAYVSVEDRAGGFIEAAFGLVNNERVRCTLQRTGDDARTAVRVEAFFPAGAEIPERSRAVEALAAELLSER